MPPALYGQAAYIIYFVITPVLKLKKKENQTNVLLLIKSSVIYYRFYYLNPTAKVLMNCTPFVGYFAKQLAQSGNCQLTILETRLNRFFRNTTLVFLICLSAFR